LNLILKTINILKDKHKIVIVVGGCNFFRGREHTDMNKVTADTIGMLGTIMNALYIKDYLENNGLRVVVSTPFDFPELLDNHNNESLINKYDNGEIIIFGGGIGKSGFSTDSGTILASEILQTDVIVKMTNVNGVYDSDPKVNKHARKYDNLTYEEVLKNNLKVMDLYAIEKCKESNIKILVINFDDYDKIDDCLNGSKCGTIIGG